MEFAITAAMPIFALIFAEDDVEADDSWPPCGARGFLFCAARDAGKDLSCD
jgi:hypothetical protein